MAIGARKAREICRRYYLDCASIADIAAEAHTSKEAVRALLDDPAVQADYLRHAERARQRTRIRAAQAADLALDRQISFLARDADELPDALRQEQQRTAERVLRRALAADREQDSKQITITWAGDVPKLGMPGMEGKDDASSESGTSG